MEPRITLRKERNRYIFEEWSFQPLDLIYDFMEDAGPDFHWAIFFLQNPEKHNMSFNECHLYKEDQEHVVLSSLYEEEIPIGEIHCTAEQLVKLIEDWKKAVEQEPEYIYVSQKTTGYFTVTTSDANA